MKHLLLASLLFSGINSFSQDCIQEALQKLPGRWKAGIQGSIVNITASDLAKEKLVLAQVHKMVSSKYTPTGCEALYSTSYGKGAEKIAWVAEPYQYMIYVLRYLCDRNNSDKSKYYVDVATPTTVTITANAAYWLNVLYAADLPVDDFRGYLKLAVRPVKKDGYYLMSEEVTGNSQLENKIKEYRWLITYNDTLPFSYVSRKEYLLIQRKRLERTIRESPGEKKYYETFLKNISNYLQKPEAELKQPAVCMWNEEERFEKFVEEGTNGSFIAVKPNLDYYRKKLSKSTPQFFTVVYKISHGDPVFEENIKNIQKAVDFSALRKMLGR